MPPFGFYYEIAMKVGEGRVADEALPSTLALAAARQACVHGPPPCLRGGTCSKAGGTRLSMNNRVAPVWGTRFPKRSARFTLSGSRLSSTGRAASDALFRGRPEGFALSRAIKRQHAAFASSILADMVNRESRSKPDSCFGGRRWNTLVACHVEPLRSDGY